MVHPGRGVGAGHLAGREGHPAQGRAGPAAVRSADDGGAAGVRVLHGGVLVAPYGAGVPGERGVPGDHGEPAAVLHDDQRVSAGTPEALRGVVRGSAEAVPGGGAGEAAARGGGRHEGEGEREQAQGDELQASGGGGEAASQGSEADAGGGGGGGRGGGRAPRRRGAWGRVAGGAQAAGEPAEAAAGSEGAPGGGGAHGAGAGVAGGRRTGWRRRRRSITTRGSGGD